MLSTHSAARKRSTRHPFLVPLWDEHHADFCRINAELPPDHHARWLKAAIARLDLTPLRRAYANRGSRAYPVELLLAFVLWMYSKKLTSPASWLEESRRNDAAKWLLLGLQPGRSTFYSFRDRLEPFLDSWHKQLIAWAVVEGLTTARSGSLDGTFVAALASRHRLLSRHVVAGRLWLLSLAVLIESNSRDPLQRLIVLWLVLAEVLADPVRLLLALLLLALLPLQEQPQAVRQELLPAWLPPTPTGRLRLLRRLEEARQRQRQRVAPLLGKERLSKKDHKALRLKVNPTDPEASLGFDKLGTYRPLYNLLLVKATDSNLILAWDLVSRNNDDGLLRPMMERTKEQLGHHLEETLIDGGFVSIDGLLHCEKHSITVYAPALGQARRQTAESPAPRSDSTPRTGEAASRAEAAGNPPEEETSQHSGESGTKPAKKYGKEKFRYDAAKKEYHCPSGKVLKEVYRTSEKQSGGVELEVLVHRAEASDCQSCGQREQCTSGKQGRVVKRYEGEEALERLRKRMDEPANQEIYRLRKQTVEPGYGELKEHRGLREFRCFGKQRSRCQAGLTILANNALSILRALSRRDGQQTAPT